MGCKRIKLVLDDKNRIVIPKKFRRYLNLCPSREIYVYFKNGEIILTKNINNWKQEKKQFQSYIKSIYGYSIKV